MRFGLFGINFGTCAEPETAVRIARDAEAAGFESIWTGEHIVLPSPQAPPSPLPPDLPFLDTVATLAWLAAKTETIRLGTGILVLPQRHPLVVAKELASIDVLSGGRLIVGLGAGYVPKEFDALSVPFERRGARLSDYVGALRAIWTMPEPSYDGEFVSFSGVDAHPRPLQKPTPPLIIGGGSSAALRRAVALGDGFYGFALTPERAAEYVDELQRTLAERPRPADLGELELTVTPIGRFSPDLIDRYAMLGIHRLVLLPNIDASFAQRHDPIPADEVLRNVERAAAVIEEYNG